MNDDVGEAGDFHIHNNTIKEIIENAERLCDELGDLEFRTSFATRYYLATIAQEEVAKSFMIYLIFKKIIPNSTVVRRSIRNHNCKHLIGILIDYMIMHWNTFEELRAEIEADCQFGENFPNVVGSALEIFRYEKVGRWENRNWQWVEDPNYDQEALKIADGKRDRRKQDALYVGLGSDGQVISTPASITQTEMLEEIEKAHRYISFSKGLIAKEGCGHFDERRFERIITAFKNLFNSSK